MRVNPRTVLATVNGAQVRLKHLMPLSYEGQRVAMEHTRFQSRLQRAIESELVFQAARAEDTGFNDAQQLRLDQILPVHDADLEELIPNGITWDSLSEQQVNFEQRMLASMMLRQNLVASRAEVAPSPDPEVQARYEVALRELMSELKAGATINQPAI